jgi:hypothetical protein
MDRSKKTSSFYSPTGICQRHISNSKYVTEKDLAKAVDRMAVHLKLTPDAVFHAVDGGGKSGRSCHPT